MFFWFLGQRIYFIWKALAEITDTKVIFLSASFIPPDVITLRGLYNCLYVYIIYYPLDDCNKWNLKLWKKLFFYPFLVFVIEHKMKCSPVHLF